jgi:TetR/AcrR family transcriptional repressor of nem operon
MSSNAKEEILGAARKAAQAHGYGGLNFRDLAQAVGIKHASVYYHFPTKADLGVAVARRYWEDTAAVLDEISEKATDPLDGLRQYASTFRKALETDNRICLCSFMAAETDDLPEAVKAEIQTFGEINVAWLSRMLVAAGVTGAKEAEQRARAIFAAIAGAQLVARSRADIAVYDDLIDGYRSAGLLPK